MPYAGKRLMLRLGTTLTLTMALGAALSVLAPTAGAATCGDNLLNVNLGSGCAGVTDLKLLNPQPAAGSNACADGAGCANLDTNRPQEPARVEVPRIRTAPAPKAPAATPKRPAPVTVVPQRTYRINAFDAADGESFYSGDFRLRLPYAAGPPAVSPLAPSRRGFAEGWSVPALPVELIASLIGGVMLLASAGGVRRMMTTA